MSKDDDQSMEEILQSIKRIIADEEDPSAPPPKDTEAKEEEAPAVEEPKEEPVAEEPAPEPAPEPEPVAEEPKQEEPLELTEVVEEGNVPEEAEEIELVAEDKPAPAPEPVPMDPVEELLSEGTAQAASAALKNLPQKPAAPTGGGLAFRSGTTVEDLVLEAMRPMLKEWLDSNLPQLVERLVEKEIKKLTD